MRKRSIGINVRVSVTEKRKMTLMAKRCGLSLSEYLRQRALGYEPGGHPPKEVFDVLDQHTNNKTRSRDSFRQRSSFPLCRQSWTTARACPGSWKPLPRSGRKSLNRCAGKMLRRSWLTAVQCLPVRLRNSAKRTRLQREPSSASKEHANPTV